MFKRSITAGASYPSSVVIKRAIQSCEKVGMSISAVEIAPDGSIRIISDRGSKLLQPDNDFDRLDAIGAL